MASIIGQDGRRREPPPMGKAHARARKFDTPDAARYLRAEGFAKAQADGYSIRQIARVYRFALSTVLADLKWFSGQRPAVVPDPFDDRFSDDDE